MIRHCLSASLLLAAACGDSAGNMANVAQIDPGNIEPAGAYRLQGRPDTASGLLLEPDGRFQYFMSAGAYDGRAEGRWSSDGRIVMLNTEPRPTPPAFSAGPVTRTAAAPLQVTVNAPNGRSIALIDVRVGLADGRVLEGETQDDGWRPPAGTRPGAPRWIELALPIYDVAPRRFPVDSRAGNAFAFRLTPNDVGVVDFRDQVFDVTPRGLVPRRRGEGVYVREQIERRERP